MRQSINDQEQKKSLLSDWIYPLAIFWFAFVLFQPMQALSKPEITHINIDRYLHSDPLVFHGRSGGALFADKIVHTKETITGSCTGFIRRQPNYILTLHSFINFLKLEVKSTLDTTIVVQGTGGVWCNDDSDDRNPKIEGQWQAGKYKIWIGSYKKNIVEPYVIRISQKK
jgi:hypothetical protein